MPERPRERALLRLVHLSGARTLEPVRKECSLPEKQQPQPARLLVVLCGLSTPPIGASVCARERKPETARSARRRPANAPRRRVTPRSSVSAAGPSGAPEVDVALARPSGMAPYPGAGPG